MIALYLLSNQHRYSEGFYRLPLSYIAEDMILKPEEILRAVEKLANDNFIKYDKANSIIMIINALKYQPLQNINHCKAALNKLDELPASPLLSDFISQAKKYNWWFCCSLPQSGQQLCKKSVYKDLSGSKYQKAGYCLFT